MIDYNNLTNLDNNIFVFYSLGTSVWQTWQKPRGCKFVQFLVIGGGGGGGAGGSRATGTQRSGGGGGGSSGVSKFFIPSTFVSNELPTITGQQKQLFLEVKQTLNLKYRLFKRYVGFLFSVGYA